MKLENVLPCFVAAPLLIPNSLNWECYSTWALISLFYPEKSFNQSVLLAGHNINRGIRFYEKVLIIISKAPE